MDGNLDFPENSTYLISTNNKQIKYQITRGLQLFEAGLLIILVIIIFVSSMTVLLVVYSSKKLHTVPGYLMVALSIFDLLIVFGQMLPSIVADVCGEWIFPKLICCVQSFSVTYFSSMESAIIMLCAVDRAFAIGAPLFYTQHRDGRSRMFLALFIIVFCSNLPFSLLAVSSYAVDRIVYLDYYGLCVSHMRESYALWLPITVYILQFAIPGVVIVFCYSFIFCRVIKARRKKPGEQLTINGSSKSSATKNGVLRQLRLCKMLILISILYFVSVLPDFFYSFFGAMGIIKFDVLTHRIAIWLTFINSITDGFVFYCMSRTFQETLKLCLHRHLGVNFNSKSSVQRGDRYHTMVDNVSTYRNPARLSSPRNSNCGFQYINKDNHSSIHLHPP